MKTLKDIATVITTPKMTDDTISKIFLLFRSSPSTFPFSNRA